MSILLAFQGAGGAFTLTVSPAVVPLVGQSVALRAARQLTINPATAPLNGQSIALRADRRLAVSPATVLTAGQVVALRADRSLTASPTTVPIVGQSVALRTARRLTVSSTTVPLAGQSVSLRTDHRLAVLPTNVPVAGQSVSLRAARQLLASAVTVPIAGQSINLTKVGSFSLIVSPAIVTIVGQLVTLLSPLTDDLGMALNDIRSAVRLFLLANSNVAPVVGGTRMYPVVLPQGVTEPSIVYNVISGQGDHHMQGPSGLNRIRFQLDAYSLSYDDAVELANLVKEALDGYAGPMSVVPVQGAFFDTERDDYQSDVNLYRVSRDYLIWFEER